MYPAMMPMAMGPMMSAASGTPLAATAEQSRAALEAQKQEMLRLKEAAEFALSQIEDELSALESDATDDESQHKAQVASDANQLRAMTAQVDLQTQVQSQVLAQQARFDRMRMNQNIDRRQWVAGGEEFGRPVM